MKSAPCGVRARRAQGGMSLIEMTIAMVILGSVMLALSAGMTSVFGVFRGTVTSVDLDRRLNVALDRVAAELADVPAAALTTDFDAVAHTSMITYRAQTGWSEGAALLGATTTIAWESDPADPADGADNDGDGLVDEGMITRATAGGSPITVATGIPLFLEGETADDTDENGNGLVDEAGLCFAVEDGVLVIRVTMTRRGGDGQLVTKTIETALRMQE